jgi:hypothetical protein
MSSTTFAGIFCFGFVFGYLLYYAVRHTKEFNIEVLSSAAGAIGGGVLVGYFQRTEGWIGPYGLGIGAGFIFYLILALILILTHKPEAAGTTPVMTARKMLTQTLLGTPTNE